MADQTPEEVEAIADAATRARVATESLSAHQSLVTKLARIRRQAVAELRSSGMSYAEVGEALGISRGRIAQLRSARHVIEEEFFGGTAVTITTPLRSSELARPVIAQEDFEASATLSRFLNGAEIETSLSHVSPAGEIDFSPPALVAICGPKSSPVMARAIATDPAFEFSPDNLGRWRLRDRQSGEEYVSPLDLEEPRNEDFAYLARLRRPTDGRPFLLIAGIHAIGSYGVAHFLSQTSNLHDLHHEVRGHRFSTVIESSFTKDPLAITTSRMAAPLRIQEAD